MRGLFQILSQEEMSRRIRERLVQGADRQMPTCPRSSENRQYFFMVGRRGSIGRRCRQAFACREVGRLRCRGWLK